MLQMMSLSLSQEVGKLHQRRHQTMCWLRHQLGTFLFLNRVIQVFISLKMSLLKLVQSSSLGFRFYLNLPYKEHHRLQRWYQFRWDPNLKLWDPSLLSLGHWTRWLIQSLDEFWLTNSHHLQNYKFMKLACWVRNQDKIAIEVHYSSLALDFRI